MGISHHKVIIDLINERNIGKMVELGVWRCGLVKWTLRLCPNIQEIWLVDPFKIFPIKSTSRMSKLTEQDWDKYYSRTCRYMAYSSKVRTMRLKSLEAVTLFPDSYFDLVYIDTTHQYLDTLSEIKVWLPKVKKGGILGGHDYETTRVEHAGVKKAVDEILGEGNIRKGEDMVWLYQV